MRIAKLLPVLLSFPMLSPGQFGRGSWTTFGGDPQRTGWNKTETDLTPESVKHLKLEWSVKLRLGGQGAQQPDRAAGARQHGEPTRREGSGDRRWSVQ